MTNDFTSSSVTTLGPQSPDRLPAFIEASRHADVVIGNRRERRAMPLLRRIGNRAASLGLLASSRVSKDGEAKSALHTAIVDFFVFPIYTFEASTTFVIQLLV